MFVADVKCSQETWQTVPNSRTGSAKASVSKAVVCTWYHTHVIGGRPKGSSVAFGDEMDIISQVRRHLTMSQEGPLCLRLLSLTMSTNFIFLADYTVQEICNRTMYNYN